MRKYLDLSFWIILFALLPVSLLAFLSQNAVPGELFYPVKRGLENVVLVASSIHPATKVAFRTDLTERRFAEAQSLLILQGQTTALTDFVVEFKIIEEELAQISSYEDKKELSDKLIARINDYETKLVAYKAAIEQAPTTSQPLEPTSQPQQPAPSTPPPVGQTISPTPVPSPVQQIPVPKEQTSPPTQKPAISLPQTQESPTPVPILDPVKKEKTITDVGNVIKELDEIEERAKRRKADAEADEKIKQETKRIRENEEGRGEGRGRNDDHD